MFVTVIFFLENMLYKTNPAFILQHPNNEVRNYKQETPI